MAIWLGNLLYFWSHDVFAEALLDVPTEAANHARDVWTRALTKVWASQHLDLLESAHGSSAQSVDSARTVARLKGRYAAATPLQLGAALAGGSKSLDQALARFGEPLGEAYILRNDLEGVFGDASTIDAYPKDLQERRLSTLVAIAMKRATPAQNDILKDVGSPDLSEVQMNEIKEVLEATGARAETERLSENLATQALDAAGADDFPGWAQQIFASIVNAIMKIHSIE
ncbi:hypothetical protein AWN90_07040 [Nocardia terpenica]|uniref:Geranylgeranyl pyrophosphate synthase n=1 Tax=Nocardia terpenica TaxID=455432 RepID=A0A164IV16_9NOCA|nr:hypothetical protein AWN90_07040 [Nocardia terpenica]